MSTRRLIGPFGRVAQSDVRSTAGHSRPIPEDLLRQASRRLAILALVGCGLWFFGPALGHVAAFTQNATNPRWARFGETDIIAAGSIAVSLALFFYLRRRDPDPLFVTDLALVYLVTMTFSIGLMMHMMPVSLRILDTSPMITWAGPVILMVAAIVPIPPWKMLLAGFVAASMDPVGMLIARAAGTFQFNSIASAFLMHYPNYLMLGVAVVISGVLTRLGQQVAREREMGSYRLGELLGRGGMGEVYQATLRMLDFVKVLDFGLVKSVAAGSDGDSLATAAGLTPGTPAYMSPEMSRGDAVDSPADMTPKFQLTSRTFV